MARQWQGSSFGAHLKPPNPGTSAKATGRPRREYRLLRSWCWDTVRHSEESPGPFGPGIPEGSPGLKGPGDSSEWRTVSQSWCPNQNIIGPATTQNLVVKFDGEICGGVLVENASDDFPSERSSKISFQTSPEVRHQFRRKLRQLHSGNCPNQNITITAI